MSGGAERFAAGRVVATDAAGRALMQAGVPGLDLLSRHLRGDWGEVSPEGREENERALRDGRRVASVYRVGTVWVWVVTEADRSRTTIMLPEEYGPG